MALNLRCRNKCCNAIIEPVIKGFIQVDGRLYCNTRCAGDYIRVVTLFYQDVERVYLGPDGEAVEHTVN